MDLLVAVGGTGQHVALAVARAALLGAYGTRSYKVVVLDADQNGEISKRLSALGERVFVRRPDMIQPFAANTSKAIDTFRELFINAKSPDAERELLELLFDEQTANIKISDGMFGCPAMSSTVFSDSCGGGDNALGKVEAAAQESDVERVILCGSFVGGTGAGILHKLATRILRPMHGVFFLPWFQPSKGDDNGPGGVTRMNLNMKHGLMYLFDHTQKRLVNSVILGIPPAPTNRTKPREMAQGGTPQPHFLHVVAANCVARLPIEAPVLGTHAHAAFVWGHDEDISSLATCSWGSENDLATLGKLLAAARVTAAALGVLLKAESASELSKDSLDLGAFTKSKLATARKLAMVEKKGFLGGEKPSVAFMKDLCSRWTTLKADLDDAVAGIEGTEDVPLAGPLPVPDSVRQILNPRDRKGCLALVQEAWKDVYDPTACERVDTLADSLTEQIRAVALRNLS